MRNRNTWSAFYHREPQNFFDTQVNRTFSGITPGVLRVHPISSHGLSDLRLLRAYALAHYPLK
jgi:hypothetical protein